MKIEADLHTNNHVLNSLTAFDLVRLKPKLEPVNLPLGDILYKPDQEIDYLYFPNSAMVSVVAYTPEGQGCEVAVVGSEGIVGLEVLLGSPTAAHEHVVQLSDGAHRMSAASALEEFRIGGDFHDLALSYLLQQIRQVSQTALCNRLHTIEQRLTRWLLMCHDRSDGPHLELTQEFLSLMLGASRPSVSTAAAELQKDGMISYSRGNITILNRQALEEFTCSCYEIVKTSCRGEDPLGATLN